MPTIQQVVVYNKVHVNWNSMFSVIETIGNTMNGPKDRFDKSDLIEMALARYSNNNISYINKEGVDHLLLNLPNDKNTPTTQEMKFLNSVFYKNYKRGNKDHGKGVFPKQSLLDIKLINSMGTNKHTSLPENYAEFLLVVDFYSVHVIRVNDLKPYLHYTGDGIYARKVPTNIFSKIIGPEDVQNKKTLDNYNYKTEKVKFQQDFLGKFV